MKMHKRRTLFIFQCQTCHKFIVDYPRVGYRGTPYCEACYQESRQANAYVRRYTQRQKQRNEAWRARSEHIWRLRVRLANSKPDAWRDYVRLSLVRMLDSRIRELEAG